MDSNKVDKLLIAYSAKLPPESLNMVREKLIAYDDESTAHLLMVQMKDPTIALILSICLGVYGVDRFYIGDIGMGIGKLITCGGCAIWAIIDFFLIMDATRKKNLESLLMKIS